MCQIKTQFIQQSCAFLKKTFFRRAFDLTPVSLSLCVWAGLSSSSSCLDGPPRIKVSGPSTMNSAHSCITTQLSLKLKRLISVKQSFYCTSPHVTGGWL